MNFQDIQEGTQGDIKQYILEELESSQKALKEVNLMLDQSQGELNKLSQRNASINSHLKQIQAKILSEPIEDVQMTYDAALDTQQRLLIMRGQLDKLQADKKNLEHLISLLSDLQDILASTDENSEEQKSTTSILEMMINAQESERHNLSKQMHDGPAQALSNFIVQTEISSKLMDTDQIRAKEELNNLKKTATSTFQKVRDFIFDLRPMMLDDLGLFPTLRRYISNIQEKNPADVQLTIQGPEQRFESYIEVMLFRAVQELIRNALQFNVDNLNTLNIEVKILLAESIIRVSVIDTGKGFSFEEGLNSSGVGLKLIKERTELIGGVFEINTAPGNGCSVTFEIPIQEFSIDSMNS